EMYEYYTAFEEEFKFGAQAAIDAIGGCKEWDAEGLRHSSISPASGEEPRAAATSAAVRLDVPGELGSPASPAAPAPPPARAAGRVAGGYLELGRLYLDAKLNHAALDSLKKGLNSDSANPDIHRALVVAYLRFGNQKESRRHLELAQSIERK